jgi:hypothetical protein
MTMPFSRAFPGSEGTAISDLPRNEPRRGGEPMVSSIPFSPALCAGEQWRRRSENATGRAALGIFLLTVELWWFIARPILAELTVWRRRLAAARRLTWRSAATALGAGWLPRREVLGTLIDPTTRLVEAYVDEADLARIHRGASTRFFPENGDTPVELTLTDIATASVKSLDSPALASQNGGGLPVRKDQAGRMLPDTAVYRTLLAPTEALPAAAIRLLGNVVIAADRASMIERLYRRAVAIVIRETGF